MRKKLSADLYFTKIVTAILLLGGTFLAISDALKGEYIVFFFLVFFYVYGYILFFFSKDLEYDEDFLYLLES